MSLTQARLKELLDYNPETGVFTWKVSRRRVKAGAKAGSVNSGGYINIQVDKKIYLAHRLAWFFTGGSWPTESIDHRNGDTADNQAANLREATLCQNHQNQKIRSCFSGINLRPSGNWTARITANKSVRTLGTFPTHAMAHAAYLAAKQQLHGEYAR